jgi:D-inositol-3-phosphate glycosyltransferase
VAADVGGLQTLVDHGRTGFRVAGREPAEYAAAVDRILDSPELAARLGARAAEMATGYTWSTMAGRLRRVYDDLRARELLDCLA